MSCSIRLQAYCSSKQNKEELHPPLQNQVAPTALRVRQPRARHAHGMPGGQALSGSAQAAEVFGQESQVPVQRGGEGAHLPQGSDDKFREHQGPSPFDKWVAGSGNEGELK